LSLNDLVAFLEDWRRRHPTGGKDALVRDSETRFRLGRDGALRVGQHFALRINENTQSEKFPHAVVAIRKIVKYDHLPVVACLLTPTGQRLLLANTSFVRKVSHSSHRMRRVCLRGSILGNDIMSRCCGIPNSPENFQQLWSIHEQSDREANLDRIVEGTIGGRRHQSRWKPDAAEREAILAAPKLARNLAARTVLGLPTQEAPQEARPLSATGTATIATTSQELKHGESAHA